MVYLGLIVKVLYGAQMSRAWLILVERSVIGRVLLSYHCSTSKPPLLDQLKLKFISIAINFNFNLLKKWQTHIWEEKTKSKGYSFLSSFFPIQRNHLNGVNIHWKVGLWFFIWFWMKRKVNYLEIWLKLRINDRL